MCPTGMKGKILEAMPCQNGLSCVKHKLVYAKSEVTAFHKFTEMNAIVCPYKNKTFNLWDNP